MGITNTRKFIRLGHLANGISIIPFNHCLSSLKRAVAERVFFVKEKGSFVRPPKPKHFASKLCEVYQSLKPHLPRTAPWTYAEFIASCKGRKAGVYQRAYDSLVAEGPIVAKDAEVKVFIKYEKVDCTSKVDPVPRVISPRSPRFNLALGKFLKKIEPKIFKALSTLFNHPTVIKGYNPYRSATLLKEKWDMFKNPVAIGLDASRFDQHVSVEAIKFEHQLYLDCFPVKNHRDKLERLLKMQIVNHCAGYCPDGNLFYTIEGTRMSGDMNTSLGNCVLMCSMIQAYLRHVQVNAQLANNGDDCVVFMEREDLQKFSDGLFEWFYNMGFNMKIEAPVYEFEQIEFCQTHPVFDGRRWLMCRSPKAVFAKDTCFLQPFQSAKQIEKWLGAVGKGGLRTTGGLPILQEFYELYDRHGRDGGSSDEYLSWYMRNATDKMDRFYGPVTPEARASFMEAFNITPDEQVYLEENLRHKSIDVSNSVHEVSHEDFMHDFIHN